MQGCDVDVVERHLLARAKVEEHVAAHVMRVRNHRGEIGGTGYAVEVDLVSACTGLKVLDRHLAVLEDVAPGASVQDIEAAASGEDVVTVSAA